ncbi:MAG: carbon-nitrogen hydrolase family protein [Clostridiales Family XIII bacterium]|jgi:predicted amidohydrolase|nr:carbon-nitrogen hydrolase family protein [Clostridiales Family XIII bacterium]
MKFKLALCQMKGSVKKSECQKSAVAAIREAAAAGAQVVSLPEIWNCPYSNSYFRDYAEDGNGESVLMMSESARENKIWLIGGSIPEISDGNIYNTSYIFSPEGKLVGKHRKIHLFDVNIPGGIQFFESNTLSAGSEKTVFDTEFGKIGVAICFDVRFPDLFSSMTNDGARLIVLPAAFNMTTGPAHWDIIMRARALDNQIYFAACAPARDLASSYHSYGHSCIINPWGEFCAKADSRECIIYSEIDYDYLEEIRTQIPTHIQRNTNRF